MSLLQSIKNFFMVASEEISQNIDSHTTIPLLQKDIKDSEEAIRKSIASVSKLIAKEEISAKKIESLQKDLTDNESYIKQAIEQKNETLSAKLATAIIGIRQQLKSESNIHSQYSESIIELSEMIKVAKSKLDELRFKVDVITATSVIQETAKEIGTHCGVDLTKVQSLSNRIAEVQNQQEIDKRSNKAQAKFYKELEGNSVDEKELTDSGILPKGDSIESVINEFAVK